MSMPSAPTGGLCADLNLAVTDPNTTAPDTGSVYAASPLSSTMAATNVYSNAATPSLTWTSGGTSGAGTGASANTFTFNVTKGTNFNTNGADAGTSCTFAVRFTQTSA
jgi:hypothetical protein